jgi:glycosyltransferase involved in cell wall biosynthesis
MANILFFSGMLPYPLTNGWYLRVHYLSQALSLKHNCYLAAFSYNSNHLKAVEKSAIFKGIHLLEPIREKQRISRHFRSSNDDLYKKTYPNHYKQVVSKLKSIISSNNIDLIIVTRLNEAEYVTEISQVKKIVDDFDCHTLRLERDYIWHKSDMTLPQRASHWLNRRRVLRHESHLTNAFDLVTTISKSDQKRLREISKVCPDTIVVVPNGVSADFIDFTTTVKENPKSVVFWGNLAFPPNYSAVKYFYEKIYLPFLEKEGIRWSIVGAEADEWIKSLADNHTHIEVTGFIDNLLEFVAKMPIMINPMVIGTGLKNKVLEAFALQKTVISTKIGIEAIDAQPNLHFIQADNPKEFSDAILFYLNSSEKRKLIGIKARQLVLKKYTWETIGSQWRELVSLVLEAKLRPIT